MDREQRIVFVQAQTVCAMAEIEAMKAANREREDQGKALAYDEAAFMSVPDQFLIGHNAVISYLMEM